jgi:integrase
VETIVLYAIWNLLLARTLGLVFPSFRLLKDWMPLHLKYLAAQSFEEKTHQNRLVHVKRVMAGLGHMRIGAIKPHHVAQYIRNLTTEHSDHIAKRCFIEVRCIFREALAYGWVDRDPTAAIKPPTVEIKRQRLSFADWQVMADYAFDNCQPWVYNMLLLALVTGQRRSDLQKMKWSDVWDGHLHVAQSKTGARVAIPLSLRLDAVNMTLATALKNIKRNRSKSAKQSEYILCKNNGRPLSGATLSYRFECVREACLPECTDEDSLPASLHEIRSLAARCYDKEGKNVQKLLGHSQSSMTRLYLNLRGLPENEQTWVVADTNSVGSLQPA